MSPKSHIAKERKKYTPRLNVASSDFEDCLASDGPVLGVLTPNTTSWNTYSEAGNFSTPHPKSGCSL